MKLPASECINNESYSTFFMATEKQVIGEICLTDEIRPEAVRP